MKTSIYPLIVVGTVVLIFISLSLIFFVVFYQRKQFIREIKNNEEKQKMDAEYQRNLLENSLNVQEIERRRLAKDLHDEVGAILSALKMNNGQVGKLINLELDKNQSFSNNKELIDESINLVRNISKDLVPQTLENFGLVAAIDEFFSKMEKSTHIQFDFMYENFQSDLRFKPNTELLLYRVIQELTNNAIKHAKASKIELFMTYIDDSLLLNFEDNGVGFDYLKSIQLDEQTGMGLRNISSRLSVIHSELKVNSEYGQGSKFEIKVNDLGVYGKD